MNDIAFGDFLRRRFMQWSHLLLVGVSKKSSKFLGTSDDSDYLSLYNELQVVL